MPKQTTRAHPESLSGLIERVTYFNEETGFAVLKINAKGYRDLITLVGIVPSANPGEWVVAEGRWVRDREHGPQFRADKLECVAPTTREGIEKYLASGMIKGIGPVYAKKMVQRFGERIFDIIEQSSARLEEIDGIGPQRRRKIKAAWNEQRLVRDIMVFLHSHGVSTSRAVRIYKTYGDNAIETVRNNPYRLARDIPGIGFQTADRIAQKSGIRQDSIMRAEAGLTHVLTEATQEGHCALPKEVLVEQATQILEIDESIVRQGLDKSLREQELISERPGEQELVYIPYLRRAEETIAKRIASLVRLPSGYPDIHVEKAIEWTQAKTGKTLAPTQIDALRKAISSRIVILTGGPGVGKTTLVNAILMILRAKKVQCLLCAPTGRAAKRLGETSGMEARTIHRLLEVQPGTGRFSRNESNPLECDLLVVDECSMVDVPLMAALVRALPSHGHLLLVGDVDQLPSVGPGMVLAHLIQSAVVPVVRLQEIFRQAAHSRIITTAHRVNKGQMPTTARKDPDSDFFCLEREEPEQIRETMLDLIRHRIPDRFQLDPIADIQLLCPMNRGSLGSQQMNLSLQKALNPPRNNEPSVEKFGWTFQAGDKVIQTINDYDKEVFNGDIGRIQKIDPEDRQVRVDFEQREVIYDYGELDELALAYAITIHKSQGSEFPVVVMPLATQQYVMLQRNLIYTGITRGKRLVVIIGQRKAFAMAVRHQQSQQRCSGLLARLVRAF